MNDLIIIGAGPGGIALAAEACASGINQSQILVLEKGATHNSAIRQLYPDQKRTTANYKGFDARCEGLLCVSDMTKSETKAFFDKRVTRISMEAPAIRSQLNLCLGPFSSHFRVGRHLYSANGYREVMRARSLI